MGNVPLVWSHAGVARATYVLDAEMIRARHGTAAPWARRLARYARLETEVA